MIGIGVGGAIGGSVSGPGGMSTVSSLRNRSLSRSSKRGGDSHPKLKQKGTQTELYEDSFGSDEESLTSNEEIDNIQITADYAENGTENKYIINSAPFCRRAHIYIFTTLHIFNK